MISQTVLNKAIENGYDSNVTNQKLSLMLLLLRKAEEVNNELLEYLTEHKLGIFSIKKEVKSVDKQVRKLGDIIAPCAPKTIENKMAFFQDYESFSRVVETWSNHQPDNNMVNAEIGVSRAKRLMKELCLMDDEQFLKLESTAKLLNK